MPSGIYKRTKKHNKNISRALKGRLISKESITKQIETKKRLFKEGRLNLYKFPIYKAETHWNWKGGITPENQRVRMSKEMQNWRKRVFERDKYTCTKCGAKSGIGNGHVYLNADHIKPFAKFPELRFELSNGRTLCRSCHQKTETWGRRNSIYGDRQKQVLRKI